jgi:hypothetical protein
VSRYRALAAEDAELTVVFDAGQNSAANFAHLTETGLHFVGSLPPSDHPGLLALPTIARHLVDVERFGGLGAYDTRTTALGADRRVILTHSRPWPPNRPPGSTRPWPRPPGHSVSWPPPWSAAKPAATAPASRPPSTGSPGPAESTWS